MVKMAEPPLEKIAEAFAKIFETWGLRLPAEDLSVRRTGQLFERGWSIRWVFGSDGADEYLEYYAMHPMTNDRRCRLYASGRYEEMPAAKMMMVYPKDATPAEETRITAGYLAANRELGDELRLLGLIGADPPSP